MVIVGEMEESGWSVTASIFGVYCSAYTVHKRLVWKAQERDHMEEMGAKKNIKIVLNMRCEGKD